LWKKDKVFHRDDIREPYTDGFLKGAAGKERKATKGRFSKGDKKTTYTAHTNGALPRDVIKIPALAGGAGMNERVDHPTQKPLALCDKLIRSCKQPAKDGYVLVPFAGSGSECVAAKKIGLPFIGIEINTDYINIINTFIRDKWAFFPDLPSDKFNTKMIFIKDRLMIEYKSGNKEGDIKNIIVNNILLKALENTSSTFNLFTKNKPSNIINKTPYILG
jgi:hypothetical protein